MSESERWCAFENDVLEGRFEEAQKKISQGVNVNRQYKLGWTVLHWCVNNQNHESIEWLLFNTDIDTTIKDSKGKTALDIAKTDRTRNLLQTYHGMNLSQRLKKRRELHGPSREQLEKERRERERQERERQERERQEKERLEIERKEKERQERKRKERERQEKERQEREKERLARMKTESLVEYNGKKEVMILDCTSVENLTMALQKGLSLAPGSFEVEVYNESFNANVLLKSGSVLPAKPRLKVTPFKATIQAPGTPPAASKLASSSSSPPPNEAAQHAQRTLDVEVKRIKNPITGLKKTPLVSLEEAVTFACQNDPELADEEPAGWIFLAKMDAEEKIKGTSLTVEEVGAIHLYTQETPFYRVLNMRLRSEKRDELPPFFRFIKLLLSGLRKLPPMQETVYRGVKMDLSSEFKKNDMLIWWAFNSTAASVQTLENPVFLGTQGTRTMFTIKCLNGVDICHLAAIQAEREILLLPGTCLKVEGILNVGSGLTIIQMTQILVPGLIDF